MLKAVLSFAGLILNTLYSLVTVVVFFSGFSIVVSAFDYPPYYSPLMIIGGAIAIFLSDWMMQNPPSSLFFPFSHHLTARPG